MLLSKLVDTVKGERNYTVKPIAPYFVKGILDKRDAIPEKSRAATYKGYVHVSSLSGDFCARHYAIAQHEELQLYETLTGGHKITFKIGRAVEEHIRTNLIEGIGKQNIYAMWTCECQKDKLIPEEGTFRVGLWKPALCKCGKPLDTMEEPAITDETNGVSGRPDLVIYKDKTLHVTEIKSIKKDSTSYGPGWDEITEPLDSHIRQNIFYPPLLRAKNLPVSPIVTFIYCTKDFKYGSPYKEFQIDTSLPKYEALRQELLAEAKQVKDFIAGGESPPRICASEAGPLAKKCPVSFRCFNIYRDKIE